LFTKCCTWQVTTDGQAQKGLLLSGQSCNLFSYNISVVLEPSSWNDPYRTVFMKPSFLNCRYETIVMERSSWNHR
jgi:hypothetical protein